MNFSRSAAADRAGLGRVAEFDVAADRAEEEAGLGEVFALGYGFGRELVELGVHGLYRPRPCEHGPAAMLLRGGLLDHRGVHRRVFVGLALDRGLEVVGGATQGAMFWKWARAWMVSASAAVRNRRATLGKPSCSAFLEKARYLRLAWLSPAKAFCRFSFVVGMAISFWKSCDYRGWVEGLQFWRMVAGLRSSVFANRPRNRPACVPRPSSRARGFERLAR